MRCKSDQELFVAEIKDRGINSLVHFTSTINLMSMFEQGHILSCEELKRLGIDNPELDDYVEFNDSMRLDKRESYINTSVMFPNHFLFSRFRQKSASAYMHWCVIRIDPKYIYAEETLFSVTNAASSAARNQYGIRGDIEAFRKMFAEPLTISGFSGQRTLVRSTTADHHTTCVQAEVLVKERIPVTDIIDVCFKDEDELSAPKAAVRVQGLSCNTSFTVDKTYFGKRG